MIAINPANRGLLHKNLGVAPGKKLSLRQLARAARSPDAAERKRAVFAENARKWAK